MRKQPTQLELFAARDSATLGILGWRDPVWTQRFTVTLLDGTELTLTLATVRQLHRIVRSCRGAQRLALFQEAAGKDLPSRQGK